MEKDLEEFFAAAKRISLKPAEADAVWLSVEATMHANAVRVEGGECHTDDMSDPIETLRQAKHVTMSSSDTDRVDRALASYMRSHPVSIQKRGTFFAGLSSLRRLVLSPALIASLIALVAGFGGVSYAAASSLPGDPLYGFKLNVNEKIGALLHRSPKAATQYDAQLALRRLEEAEILESSGRMSADKKTAILENFANHAQAVKNQIASLSKQDDDSAADLSAGFEASLNAHAKILGLLQNRDEHVASIQTQVRQATNDIRQERISTETKVRAGTDQKNSAEKTMNEAERHLDNLRVTLRNQSGSSLQKAVSQDVSRASLHLDEARQHFSGGDYSGTVLRASQAKREAEESDVLTETVIHSHLPLSDDAQEQSESGSAVTRGQSDDHGKHGTGLLK